MIPEARNRTDNLQVRYEYSHYHLRQNEDKVIFLDEFGISCSTRTAYGRSEVGTTSTKIVRTIRSKNISTSAAMSKNEIIYFKTIENTYNEERY